MSSPPEAWGSSLDDFAYGQFSDESGRGGAAADQRAAAADLPSPQIRRDGVDGMLVHGRTLLLEPKGQGLECIADGLRPCSCPSVLPLYRRGRAGGSTFGASPRKPRFGIDLRTERDETISRTDGRRHAGSATLGAPAPPWGRCLRRRAGTGPGHQGVPHRCERWSWRNLRSVTRPEPARTHLTAGLSVRYCCRRQALAGSTAP